MVPALRTVIRLCVARGSPSQRVPRWRLGVAAVAAATVLVTGCTYRPNDDPMMHFSNLDVPAPSGRTVHVCSAYGCRTKTKVRFSDVDVSALADLRARTRRDDSPHEERRAIAYAIGWIETTVGNRIGTSKDRPGMDFIGSGDPTQHDCVDEATNSTSYLKLLAGEGLIRHHKVGAPFAKENYLRGVAGWTHWTAVLVEPGGQRWAVDSWPFRNGENPAVVKAEAWYIAELDSLPPSTR